MQNGLRQWAVLVSCMEKGNPFGPSRPHPKEVSHESRLLDGPIGWTETYHIFQLESTES